MLFYFPRLIPSKGYCDPKEGHQDTHPCVMFDRHGLSFHLQSTDELWCESFRRGFQKVLHIMGSCPSHNGLLVSWEVRFVDGLFLQSSYQLSPTRIWGRWYIIHSNTTRCLRPRGFRRFGSTCKAPNRRITLASFFPCLSLSDLWFKICLFIFLSLNVLLQTSN
jgi:hypothetical protein